ncbi:Ferritin-1 chloroplastic [Fasciola hepatica]|uniref:Ferritin n=2 Tax=Fasciola TaxID=6191 RepID=A0A4E0RCY3_FASHE|nr:Ferritin-1 chloroplastic [Fasciola hepatica]
MMQLCSLNSIYVRFKLGTRCARKSSSLAVHSNTFAPGGNMSLISLFLLVLSTACVVISPMEVNDPFRLHSDLEVGFNNQILAEYEAFYVYEHMAAYFSRPDVGLLGFAKFFKESANEEVEHARKFTEFINKRSGRVVLQHVMLNSETAPMKYESIKDAIDLAIAKEMHVSRLIKDIHLRASQLNDAQAQHFLDDFLMEQVDSTAKLRVIRSRLALDSSATFLLDQELR